MAKLRAVSVSDQENEISKPVVSLRGCSGKGRAIRGDMLFSSFTDNGVFPSTCAEIAKDAQRFNEFRREPVIVRAMEHESFSTGQIHLESVRSCCPERLGYYLDAGRQNDAVGHPIKYEYSPYGCFSPKTLEYVRIAHDLNHIFGDLSGYEILEIGGGYGGQALVLSCLFDLLYTILDLPEVLSLQRRFHATSGIYGISYASAPDQLQNAIARPSHLLISNSAFAECRKDVQEVYLTSILAYAKRGYMACNFVMRSRRRIPLIGKYELLRNVKGSYYVDELPEIYLENRILLWDRSAPDKYRSRRQAVLSELRRDCRVMPKRLIRSAAPDLPGR